MRIFVGNVAYDAESRIDEVKAILEECGPVQEFSVISDRETKQFKGFCFADMADADARRAIEEVNGAMFAGRALIVSEAHAKPIPPPKTFGKNGRDGARRQQRERR